MRLSRPALPALLAVAVLGLSACGEGDPAPYDDGGQAVPLAGLGAQVESAGVDVVSVDRPRDAVADEVVQALQDAGFADAAVEQAPGDAGPLAVDAGATAGLLAVAGPGAAQADRAVVLVFTGPEAAAVFAAADPRVFDDASDDRVRAELLSGNLVAYAVGSGPEQRVRTAVEALAGDGS